MQTGQGLGWVLGRLEYWVSQTVQDIGVLGCWGCLEGYRFFQMGRDLRVVLGFLGFQVFLGIERLLVGRVGSQIKQGVWGFLGVLVVEGQWRVRFGQGQLFWILGVNRIFGKQVQGQKIGVERLVQGYRFFRELGMYCSGVGEWEKVQGVQQVRVRCWTVEGCSGKGVN